MKKTIFCANCQKETQQFVEIFPTEIVASCECGRQVKFPPLKDAGALTKLLGLHKEHNQGQAAANAVVATPDPDVLAAIENA